MNKFEEYSEFVGAENITDKEELLERFKHFLDNPMVYGGFFIVRWSENDNSVNTKSLEEYVKNC